MSQIQTKFLENSAITTAKIGDDQVTNAKIAPDAVGSTEIANDAVIEAKIADGAVSLNKLAANSVDASKIVTGAVGFDELASGAITGQTDEPSPDNADLLLIYDDSAASLKKMTRANFLSGIVSTIFKKETFVLSGTDITNQYIDLGFEAEVDSIHFAVKGSGSLLEGASYDYSVSYTGGAGGVTRITFLNDLATGGNAALVATDVVQVSYERA